MYSKLHHVLPRGNGNSGSTCSSPGSREEPSSLPAAFRQSSSALGFEEQLCCCFPGRATLSSQRYGFTVSALARKLASEKKPRCSSQKTRHLESRQRDIQPGAYSPPRPPTATPSTTEQRHGDTSSTAQQPAARGCPQPEITPLPSDSARRRASSAAWSGGSTFLLPSGSRSAALVWEGGGTEQSRSHRQRAAARDPLRSNLAQRVFLLRSAFLSHLPFVRGGTGVFVDAPKYVLPQAERATGLH